MELDGINPGKKDWTIEMVMSPLPQMALLTYPTDSTQSCTIHCHKQNHKSPLTNHEMKTAIAARIISSPDGTIGRLGSAGTWSA